ncbi:MAG TPA: type II toxin-antitoxin system VapC family toxin [Rhizomicrobium sp.]|jgi:predicted nucleic acid-binding protein
MFLLDTCVVSETVNIRPDERVVGWMQSQNPVELFISAVTLGELHFGVARLPNSARRRNLASWLEDVERHFADRIVVLDDAVAREWGRLRAAHPNIPVADAQIASTALAYDFIFVTRNVRHFRFDSLELINPWEP